MPTAGFPLPLSSFPLLLLTLLLLLLLLLPSLLPLIREETRERERERGTERVREGEMGGSGGELVAVPPPSPPARKEIQWSSPRRRRMHRCRRSLPLRRRRTVHVP